MNPEIWELLCLKASAGTKDSSAAIARIIGLTVSGMTCRGVSEDELDEAEDRLEVYMRFVDKELYDAGIPNIYFPKPGCFEICKKSFEPMETIRP